MARGAQPCDLKSIRIGLRAGPFVSMMLYKGVENVAIFIDGTPQPVFPAVAGNNHLVKMPSV